MKVAVVTAYYKESETILRRCADSVAHQTHPVTHIMVADGHPQSAIDTWSVDHIKLPHAHRDYGNTPRGIGGVSALNLGFEAVAFLDADNWYAPDHIASLVECSRANACHVAMSDRYIALPDGTILEQQDSEDFSRQHVDTSCLFITSQAAHLLPYWAMMEPNMAPLGDRIMYYLVRLMGIPHAFTGKRTLFYESNYAHHFVRAGQPVPEHTHDFDNPALLRNLSRELSRQRLGFDLPLFNLRDSNSRRALIAKPGFNSSPDQTGDVGTIEP